jgi:ketosteroid isomerase-like protein
MPSSADVVRDQFEAVNVGDFARAMDLYAEDVELFVAAGAFLQSGTFRGREAVGRWFGDWFATFEPGYRFEIEELRDVGDRVLLVASHRGRGRASGVEVRGRTGYVYGVREGRVSRVELYATREEALAAIEHDDAEAS